MVAGDGVRGVDVAVAGAGLAVTFHLLLYHINASLIVDFYLQDGPDITAKLYCICLSEHKTCA